jgi:polysaccharide export outer membrane protein
MTSTMVRLLACIACSAVLAGCGAPRTVPPPLATSFNEPYGLGTGDRLRVTVFGQANLTNTYTVDASGHIVLPLIGAVPAANTTTAALGKTIEAKLRNGFIREPNVSVEIEAYRPFFILGEVTNAGQYSYVADMTVETAVAIAGGFTPRALRTQVTLTRRIGDRLFRGAVPLTYPIRPGDTVTVCERWF